MVFTGKFSQVIAMVVYRAVEYFVSTEDIANLIEKFLERPRVTSAFEKVEAKAEVVQKIIPYISIAISMSGEDSSWMAIFDKAVSLAGIASELPTDPDMVYAIAQRVRRVCSPHLIVKEYLSERGK